jgi:hypothetical protein
MSDRNTAAWSRDETSAPPKAYRKNSCQVGIRAARMASTESNTEISEQDLVRSRHSAYLKITDALVCSATAGKHFRCHQISSPSTRSSQSTTYTRGIIRERSISWTARTLPSKIRMERIYGQPQAMGKLTSRLMLESTYTKARQG